MNEELYKKIIIFNKNYSDDFGKIDTDILVQKYVYIMPGSRFRQHNHEILYQLLFYYYPMIERLIRLILSEFEVIDLENQEHYTFKTLISIFDSNRAEIDTIFGPKINYIIVGYISHTFSSEGLRNTIMHYHKNFKVPQSAILYAKYIFLLLVNCYFEMQGFDFEIDTE